MKEEQTERDRGKGRERKIDSLILSELELVDSASLTGKPV